jgi:ribosomal protein L11 methyltransferase
MAVLLVNDIPGAQVHDNSDLRQILEDNPLSWDYADKSLFEDAGGFAVVEFYVPADDMGKNVLARIESSLGVLSHNHGGRDFGSLSLKVEAVSDESWLHEWKKHFKPLKIGNCIVVVPAWEMYAPYPGEIVFTVDPGSVFGTGQHQTTQLCLEALEVNIQPGYSLLDIGCGSGILSVVGLLLGAGYVYACDFDPAAQTAVQENLRINPLAEASRLHMQTGDFFTDTAIESVIKQRRFDLITANIVADPIICLAPLVCRYMRPGGIFIASGIIKERLEDVLEALCSNGLTILALMERDGWYCVTTVCGNA